MPSKTLLLLGSAIVLAFTFGTGFLQGAPGFLTDTAYAAGQAGGSGSSGGSSGGGSSSSGGGGGSAVTNPGSPGGQGASGGSSSGKGSGGAATINRDIGKGGGGGSASSDRPPSAGKPDGAAGNRPEEPGGGPPTGMAGRGDLYGDLWAVLRDENGLPIYVTITTEKGEVLVPQPVDANGVPIPLDAEGSPLLVLRDFDDIDHDGDTTELLVDPNNTSVYEYIGTDGLVHTIDVTYIKVDGTGYTPVASAAEASADDGGTTFTAVQEVDLGRTNVSRAPITSPSPKADSTLDNALSEALAAIDGAASITFDEAGRIVIVAADNTTTTIDSPLENLALYKYLLDGNTIAALPDTVNTLDLAAALLGAASDKSEPLDVDEVAYLNTFLDIAGTLTDAAGATYVDYSDYTYDRSAYENVEVSWLEPVGTSESGETVYELKTDTVLNAVFDGENVTATNIDAFATAADDARAVIDFIHSNLVPEMD